MLQISIWSLPPAIAAVVALVCLAQLRQVGPVPGVAALQWTLVSAAVWGGGQFAESVVTTLPLKEAALMLQYVGVLALPIAWFVFAITYSRQKQRIELPLLVLVCLVPAGALVLALTNARHGWIWSGTELVTVGDYAGILVTLGPAYLAAAVYNYALVFAALTVLTFVLTSNGNYRRPLVAVNIAAAGTAGLHFIYLSPWNAFPWFDPTPLGLSLAAFLLIQGLVHSGFVDLVPIMRDRVFEHLADAAVIVNRDGRILDVNRSATVRLLPHAGNPLNQNIAALLPSPGIAELLSRRVAHAELTVALRAYHVTVTALDGRGNPGRLALVFRDITERRNAEIQLRNAQRDLERMAHTDPLTGLYNRRFFMQRLEEEVCRYDRHGSPLSVVVFDLDLFKRVNDVYGHDVGDRALQMVATMMNDVRRATDIPARMGGEEFALLLPETDGDGATRLAQRLRAKIADGVIDDPDGNAVCVTASVGVATLTSRITDADLLLRDADQALYRAKHAGRNMVCLAA